MSSKFTRILAPVLAVGILVTTPVPAAAQSGEDARLRKIEAEIRALQRKVFPGGDNRYFEPEISAPIQARPGPTTPSTTAVTDILARLDAVETQLQRLTARAEENTNAVAQLSERIDALEAAGAPAPAPMEPAEPETSEIAISNDNAPDTNLEAMRQGGDAEPAAPSPARLAAVQEIAKPQTGDAGDDEYSYGFRLWDAGFYPEARQQLAMFLEKYPGHSRVTYGRNLLGRAYLDDGQPEEAARWFLRNYQADKQARRAGDSLLFLAESMIALGDTNRACIALAEFSETYPALASGRLQDQYEANRRKVTCN